MALAFMRVYPVVTSICCLAFADAPATRPASPASAPATAPATPTILVGCVILKDGEAISRPQLLIESGQTASIEVGNTSFILLGHEIANGTQLDLTATLNGSAIVLKGEMLTSELDQNSPLQTPDATWVLQHACRLVFEIRATDPNHWYVAPKAANGCELRLLARLHSR
jgi:hypothetical protein